MEVKSRLRYVWQRAGVRKQVEETDRKTSLNRCLTTLQMTAIGLGSTIGVGIYVLLGVAIRDYAGPGVILSFLLAGLVVLSNALIFMEFGSYIPQTGAAYTYMYFSIGEMAAFLCGWMGLFSLTSSAATGARAWSGFVDSLFNNSIQHFLDDRVGQLDIGPPFARSLDWLAFVFFLILTLVVSLNVQCSSVVNTILAVLTTGVLVFVAVLGPIVGDIKRLADPDLGGFLPYGVGGVVTGASAAFFAFNGYDSICISAEEAKDPVKSVPRAILIELTIVTVVYCGAAVGTVCLIPYTEIDLRAPIPSAFAYQGITWARIIVTIGPVIAMTNLSLTSLYAQSRILYRMAQDGLMFKKFAYINPVTKVPLLGVIVCGVTVSVIALFLELKDLVRFSVLCMLFQYIVLAPALVSLRVKDKSASTGQGEESHGQLRRNGNLNDHPRRELAKLTYSTEMAASGDGSEETDYLTAESASDAATLLDINSKPVTPSTASSSSSLFRRSTSQTYSYARDGDLGLSAQSDEAEKTEYGNFSLSGNTGHLDSRHPASSELSQSEDNTVTINNSHRRSNNRNSNNTNVLDHNSEFADESGFSEESSAFSRASQFSDFPRCGAGGEREIGNQGPHNVGCFEHTRCQFFRLLTTGRCLALLVLCLAGLAMQLGLAWEDLLRARIQAVLCTTLLIMMLIFLCEVLRHRCGPGKHAGFKVPLVPYLPALSCFLNMMLLVTAADYVGIIEFAALIVVGLVVYVIMVMTQWSRGGDVRSTTGRSILSEERYGLLAHEENDADSEGSL